MPTLARFFSVEKRTFWIKNRMKNDTKFVFFIEDLNKNFMQNVFYNVK